MDIVTKGVKEIILNGEILPVSKQLDKADIDVLINLLEECLEVGQAICKTLRFGDCQIPHKPYMTNLQDMSEELGNLLASADMANHRNLIDPLFTTVGYVNKLDKYPRFTLAISPEAATKICEAVKELQLYMPYKREN
jgi:hypothetical protein